MTNVQGAGDPSILANTTDCLELSTGYEGMKLSVVAAWNAGG